MVTTKMTDFHEKAREIAQEYHATALTELAVTGSVRTDNWNINLVLLGIKKGLEAAGNLYESVDPASDSERIDRIPGAGAMGAVIEYRDKIREAAKHIEVHK